MIGPALSALVVVLTCIRCSAPPSSVAIHWDQPRQIIEGFGASSSNFVAPLSESEMDFFYTTRGIGLSLLRTRIFPSVADCESDLDPGGACTPSTSASVLTGELRMAQLVVARGGRVWGSQWSPPGSMKTNRSFMTGGAFVGNQENLATLAAMLASFTSLMRANGVPVFAISAQNEPDMSRPYPSATWTAEQVRDEVPYLHEALARVGSPETRIMIAEQSSWPSFSLVAAAMHDPDIARHVGILAAHNYDQANPTAPPSIPNRTTQQLWQTEVAGIGPYDGSMADALNWAERIHSFLAEARVNAFHYWYLSAAPNHRTGNDALTDARGQPARRAYVIGNWSRFVRPGWHQVAVDPLRDVLVSAFQSEAHDAAAIVAINRRGRPAPVQFLVGWGGVAIPWITSDDRALAPGAGVPIADGAFSYVLPARSVVTFTIAATAASVR
jgi:glucuronoarabinoxylan endo-1,4-beta-xylanase